ncbi:MAG: nucleoside triphosphate pyrophosphohydrolase family protein [Alphaproteobacteria bacterium]|nr:nucleoside triphosphate pyrophosphohydrolase family protein [Alphaproteobacteria bacterium]
MNFTEYQKFAQRTSNTSSAAEKIRNGILGLSGETGECADLLKKHLYQGHDLDKKHMAEELGDVLWYAAEIATGLGLTLDEIAQSNLDKLWKRYPHGFDADRSIHREE